MNPPEATTIRVNKDTRALARVVINQTGETMNEMVLRLLKEELTRVGATGEKRLKEAKVKYNVD